MRFLRAIAYLLVGCAMSGWSKGMTQMTLVLQGGGWGVRPTASSRKKLMSRQPQRRLGWDGVGDREKWRRLLREARDQKGP